MWEKTGRLTGTHGGGEEVEGVVDIADDIGLQIDTLGEHFGRLTRVQRTVFSHDVADIAGAAERGVVEVQGDSVDLLRYFEHALVGDVGSPENIGFVHNPSTRVFEAVSRIHPCPGVVFGMVLDVWSCSDTGRCKLSVKTTVMDACRSHVVDAIGAAVTYPTRASWSTPLSFILLVVERRSSIAGADLWLLDGTPGVDGQYMEWTVYPPSCVSRHQHAGNKLLIESYSQCETLQEPKNPSIDCF